VTRKSESLALGLFCASPSGLFDRHESKNTSDCSHAGLRPGCDGKVAPPAGPPDERPFRASVMSVFTRVSVNATDS
jgi:hypothetical protein